MKRLFTFLLVLLLAIGAPAAAIAQVTSGLCTIGTGSASSGMVNLSDYQTVSGAVTAALNRSKTVFFLPGTYELETPITIAATDMTIMGSSAATLLVGGSSSVGLFSVTGARFKMRDVAIKFDTTVASQIAIDVSGDEPSFDGVTMTNTATDGSNSTPMSYVRCGLTTGGIAAPAFRGCRIHGAKGMILISVNGDPADTSTLGQGALFVGNHFGLETTASPEAFYKGILFDAAGEAVFTGNRVHGLGSGTDSAVAFIHSTTPNAESEAHHLTVTGNSFELVTADHLVRGDGFRFYSFTGNQVGRCGGNGASEGTFHITDNTGTGTDGGSFVFTGNEIHNASSAAGRIFWIEDTNSGLITNNMFSLVNGTVGTLNTTAHNLTIGPNRYKLATSTDPLFQISGTYTGLIINEPAIPTGIDLLSTQPTAGAVINGIGFGATTPLEGQPGIRRTRTAGAGTSTNISVAGFTAVDLVMRVTDITTPSVIAPTSFAWSTNGNIQSTGGGAVDTTGMTLIIEWYDV